MNDKFAVRLREGIDPARRAEMAVLAAPRFGIGADKIERLLSRSPGIVTKPTSELEAQRVADIFNDVGAQAEVVAMNEVAVAAAPNPPPSPAPLSAAPALYDAPSAASSTEPSAGVLASSVIWSPPAASVGVNSAEIPPPPTAAGGHTPPAVEADVTSGVDEAVTREKEAPSRGGRFSIRWKMLLATLTPILLLVGATLYFAYTSVADSTIRLLTEVGDNITLTLATDLSAYITENGLQLDNPADQEQIALHFASQLTRLAPSLHETVGVHLTDASGQRIAGFWEPEIQQNPDFASFSARFDAAAQAALQNADFGDSGEALAASLPARTKLFDSFYVIGTPLINDIGTVQAVISEGNIIQTALDVIRPIILAALIALLIAILVTVVFASTLTRSIRRLASVADRISIGDLDEPVALTGNDETRDVAEALERMRLSLQSAIGRLRRKGRRRQRV